MAYTKRANGMRLVVSVPAHEIDKDRNELVVMLLFVVSLLSVFISFWCVYMSNRIIRPLNELMISTRKIVAGDYDLDFKHRSNDEIGELMGTFRLMAKSLKTQCEFINRLVYLDSMTGAKNKRAFIDERNEINTKINESLRVGKRFDFGVIVFDVNNLKYLNDNFGHNAGDVLIKNSYSLIRNHFEESPVFRIGGDEFVAVITGKEYENRVELLTKFRSEMDYLSEQTTEPSEKVSLARGLAVFKPECDDDFQPVFERADEEMYKAKVAMKGGRDMVR